MKIKNFNKIINKKFIRDLKLSIVHKYKLMQHYHKQILHLKESDVNVMWRKVDRNPYQMLLDWLLEYIALGSVLSVGLISVHVDWNWYQPFTYGAMIWISLDLVARLKEKLK